jgi:uncharacterized protein
VKIVLDTNVLLCGVATRGVCQTILDACINSSDHELILSQPILDEFAEHYQDKFGMSAEQTRTVVKFLRENATLVEAANVPQSACRDPDDLVVLGAAAAAKADCIVTGDQDLLVLQRFQQIAIVTPRALFDQLKSTSE